MNNLLQVFKIEVAGTNLDNIPYYMYGDYDSSSPTTAPTDQQTIDKSIALLRYLQLSRLLSTYSVPVYSNVEFATPGTAKTIPTGATITVGYISYQPFLSTLSVAEQAALTTEDMKTAKAAEIIQTLINDSLKGNGTNALENEEITVQKTIQRIKNALTTSTVDFIEYENVYLNVPSVSDASVVSYVKL
ncbi:hypothetical protein [Escherichia coli]|nr:hypothetical protein [Escherichia phage UB]EFF2105854.1 hypothetical protein [Escherichia coli]MED6573182.1 hypothetical protein [Escherichia coli O157]QBO61751.1 hypothetical protein G17_00262 [Escherichia phage vB_EcoM_G17]WNN14577.1 hypothetical protein Sharanji_gp296 [Escherichia phage Sharanji]WPK18726.1 hypothetical protein [Salmonella phage SD-2_S15]WPK19377.1 hypothetical protein [Salmonella phage SD-6_S16]WPK20053.1 hypothetical protein [Salmonella phage SD-1_S14]WPK21068.1 hypo